MKSTAARVLVAACILLLAREMWAGIVSPRNGGALPPRYLELKRRSKDAFMLKRAWLERRANQVRGDVRYRLLRSPAGTALHDAGAALGGELAIPVVLGLYNDISVAPFTRNAFDTEFFTGPWTPGTIHQYWNEVSYGLFDVTGTVFDWVQLSQDEYYYTGGSSQGYLPPPYGTARTGDMIKEILDALDPSTDFGAFDNDGPDGIPNSGDDDGFVDVLLVVHPTFGAECDGISPHIWSHSWTYSQWPVSGGEPYPTNDPAAGGGSVRIDDYIVVPSLSCDTGIIEIGVICHELGHAIGLPDLYDLNGGSSGIGYWGLMGSGNWNTPASPAHPCAWSREQLGWLNPVEIGRRARTLDLDPVAATGDVLKFPLPTRRFKRTTYATNSHALVCAYNDAEASVRGWPRGGGYGNGWNESVFHEFSVDASRPVTMRYDVTIDSEDDFDFGRLLLEREGAVMEATLRTRDTFSTSITCKSTAAGSPIPPISSSIRGRGGTALRRPSIFSSRTDGDPASTRTFRGRECSSGTPRTAPPTPPSGTAGARAIRRRADSFSRRPTAITIFSRPAAIRGTTVIPIRGPRTTGNSAPRRFRAARRTMAFSRRCKSRASCTALRTSPRRSAAACRHPPSLPCCPIRSTRSATRRRCSISAAHGWGTWRPHISRSDSIRSDRFPLIGAAKSGSSRPFRSARCTRGDGIWSSSGGTGNRRRFR
ncbi:MAG: M6 family metalloprotease domain-containing protein [Candidatus Krumholzibacteria bacterium]|nr:M6 family metalloprotease domain-containing protein [Candidatus Krumholzibacteria bacterium]